MTGKLYDTDSYLTEFEARVLDCVKSGEGFLIELDKTAFFPEGGGQDSDMGTIGDAKVSHVYEKDNIICHLADAPVEKGSKVMCAIDFIRRFDHMQSHSGEHILSYAFYKLFSINNVGFHLGTQIITIDLDAVVSDEQAKEAQELSNRIVFENRPVTTLYPGNDKIAELNLRKKIDVKGEIRVVMVEDSDICACCGTHVSHTGEIGIIKIVSNEKYKKGSRISFLCGMRAVGDYDRKNDIVSSLCALMSAQADNILETVQKAVSGNAENKKKISELKNEFFKRDMRDLIANAPVIHGIKAVCAAVDYALPSDLKPFTEMIAKEPDTVAVLLCAADGGVSYTMIKSPDLVSAPLNKFAEAINSAFSGRGGGNASFAQGILFGCDILSAQKFAQKYMDENL